MPVTNAQLQDTAIAAPRAAALLPRLMTFGIRSATRAAIACAAARDSAALQRVALDVPAGVDLDRVLQK
jgi:hypothetical protein